MTDVDIEVQTPVATKDDGDHDRFAHYVPNGTEAITRAMVTGEPCTALCGKTWVPSRDPEKFPLCPDCERIKKEQFGG